MRFWGLLLAAIGPGLATSAHAEEAPLSAAQEATTTAAARYRAMQLSGAIAAPSAPPTVDAVPSAVIPSAALPPAASPPAPAIAAAPADPAREARVAAAIDAAARYRAMIAAGSAPVTLVAEPPPVIVAAAPSADDAAASGAAVRYRAMIAAGIAPNATPSPPAPTTANPADASVHDVVAAASPKSPAARAAAARSAARREQDRTLAAPTERPPPLGAEEGGETLQQALARAYQNNPDLAGARLGVSAAREDRVQAASAYLPNVSINASYGERSVFLDPRPGGRSQQFITPGTAGVSATQDLYTGGFRSGQTDRAKASYRGAREDLRQTEQQVLLSVVRAYVDVLRAQRYVRIRDDYRQSLENELNAAQRRLNVGVVTRTDVYQAQARLSSAEGDLAAAESALEQARAVFAQLVGGPPDTLAPLPDLPPAPATLNEAIERSYAANPSLLSAKQRAVAARAQIRIERSALLPKVSVVGGYDQVWNDGTRGLTTGDGSILAQVTMPIFEGGFAASRTRQSRANAERAEADTESVRRQVAANVISAWNDIAATQAAERAAEIAYEADVAALAGVTREQSLGLRTTIEVLNANQELTAAQLGLVRAQGDVFIASHALLLTMGELSPQYFGLGPTP